MHGQVSGGQVEDVDERMEEQIRESRMRVVAAKFRDGFCLGTVQMRSSLRSR